MRVFCFFFYNLLHRRLGLSMLSHCSAVWFIFTFSSAHFGEIKVPRSLRSTGIMFVAGAGLLHCNYVGNGALRHFVMWIGSAGVSIWYVAIVVTRIFISIFVMGSSSNSERSGYYWCYTILISFLIVGHVWMRHIAYDRYKSDGTREDKRIKNRKTKITKWIQYVKKIIYGLF
jgi:hypothetical protein